jgi:S1-C subfamily serine protease
MSDEKPETPVPPATEETMNPVLRREALLPNERSRGLGTVAVVCTMAGVASGLALATTLMAMQVADTMSTRSCGYRAASHGDRDHGFLGIRYVFRKNAAVVESIIRGTPAEQIGIHPGDRVIAIDGDRIDSAAELQDKIYGARPGSHPILEVERNGHVHKMRPTLATWPVNY